MNKNVWIQSRKKNVWIQRINTMYEYNGLIQCMNKI